MISTMRLEFPFRVDFPMDHPEFRASGLWENSYNYVGTRQEVADRDIVNRLGFLGESIGGEVMAQLVRELGEDVIDLTEDRPS